MFVYDSLRYQYRQYIRAMEQFADKYEELELGNIAATVDIYIIY